LWVMKAFFLAWMIHACEAVGLQRAENWKNTDCKNLQKPKYGFSRWWTGKPGKDAMTPEDRREFEFCRMDETTMYIHKEVEMQMKKILHDECTHQGLLKRSIECVKDMKKGECPKYTCEKRVQDTMEKLWRRFGGDWWSLPACQEHWTTYHTFLKEHHQTLKNEDEIYDYWNSTTPRFYQCFHRMKKAKELNDVMKTEGEDWEPPHWDSSDEVSTMTVAEWEALELKEWEDFLKKQTFSEKVLSKMNKVGKKIAAPGKWIAEKLHITKKDFKYLGEDVKMSANWFRENFAINKKNVKRFGKDVKDHMTEVIKSPF